MSSMSRRNSNLPEFIGVMLVCVILLVIDAQTKWLKTPRDLLSLPLSLVQKVAAVPSLIYSVADNIISSDVDVDIAYENLRREYFQLKSEMLLQKSLEQENSSLRELLNGSKRIEEKVALADLINVSIDPYNHRVLINKGLRHNVSVGQAIIDDKGVVGQVTEVMPFNSSVMLLTDPSHAIPVQIKRTGLRTVVFGTGNVSLLKVPFLNQNTDIKVGDQLFSSGLGARFPSGYPVATVTDIQSVPDEAFIRISAEPVTRLDRSNQVLLVTKVSEESK